MPKHDLTKQIPKNYGKIIVCFIVLYFLHPRDLIAQLKDVYGPQVYCKGGKAWLSVRSYQTPCYFQFSLIQWKRDGIPIPNTNGANSIQVDQPGNYSFDFHIIEPDCPYLKDSVYSTSPHEVYGELDAQIITEGSTDLCQGGIYKVTVIKSGLAASYCVAQSYTTGYYGQQIPIQTSYGDTTVFEFTSPTTCTIVCGAYYATPGGSAFKSCGTLDVKMNYNTCTNIEEHLTSTINRIYPNPADDLFNLELQESHQITKITIMDLMGKVLHIEQIGKHETFKKLDVSGYAAGLYVIGLIKGYYMERLQLIKR